MKKQSYIESLKNIFDPKDIEIDRQSKAFYASDWSSVEATEPLAVVFPKSKKQIKEVLKFCNLSSIPFIGSGGRTGLSGGATAINNELIISFEKMNKIIDFDPCDNTVLCHPGTTTQNLQNFAESQNLFYPIEFSSSGSSQIGGNIATNAGGIKVIKYGLTKNYVDGLEVITGDGKIICSDKRLIKNATGPDLKDIFIGSEGIFGLIVDCRMRLIKKPQETKIAIIGFNNLENLSSIRSSIVQNYDIEAIEFFTKTCLKKIHETFSDIRNININSRYYIILEYSSYEIEKLFEKLIRSKSIDDLVISQNEKQKEEMWKNRMLISESISNLEPIKFDLAVTASNFSKLVHEIELVVKKFKGVDPILFGHVGDGNLHANFVSSGEETISKNVREELDLIIFKLVHKLKGTISAEHGIGYLKKNAFLKQSSKEEINTLKSFKSFFDPKNLVNPNKLIDL